MEQTLKNNDVLLQDLNFIVREMVNNLDNSARRVTKTPLSARLQNLQNIVCSIDAPVICRPAPLERYTKDWAEFVSGNKKSLDKSAIKFLCWVPEVAVDVRFLAFVDSSGIELDWRLFAGLVRSYHCMWEKMPPECPSIHIIRSLLNRYRGTHQVLLKWQIHFDALLTRYAPRIMADMFLHSKRSVTSFVEEWHIELQSAFFRRVVEIATATCRNQLDKPAGDFLVLLFRDLLPWPGWIPSNFKKEIGAIVLYKPMSDQSREMIQRFILHFKGLGDPRIPANRVKWAEVPEKAKDLLIHWLCQENPYIFPEHVYQQGKGWIWKQKASIRDPLSFEEAELCKLPLQ
jgi:hypothetical protein